MKNQKIAVSIILGVVFLGLASSVSAEVTSASSCAVLSRNVHIGMSGSDVKLLQEVLNRDKETRLADTGPGSLGNETQYFGQVTKAAVVRFQEIYKNEVLTPVGLTSGSGFVGTFTRAKMLALCKSPQASGTPVLPVVPVAPPVVTPTTPATTPLAEVTTASLARPALFKSDVPVLMFPSTYSAPRGTTVGISGVGLASSGNIVHLDNYAIASTTIEKNGSLSFVIPVDAPLGEHELWVSSSKGNTNKTFFIVTEPKVAPPVVTGFTPTEGFYGTIVTVTGTGFLLEGNEVRISYGVIKDIPSIDGKTLQFTVAPTTVQGLGVGEDRPEFDIKDPQGFFVANSSGLSKGSVFYLKI